MSWSLAAWKYSINVLLNALLFWRYFSHKFADIVQYSVRKDTIYYLIRHRPWYGSWDLVYCRFVSFSCTPVLSPFLPPPPPCASFARSGNDGILWLHYLAIYTDKRLFYKNRHFNDLMFLTIFWIIIHHHWLIKLLERWIYFHSLMHTTIIMTMHIHLHCKILDTWWYHKLRFRRTQKALPATTLG